MAIARQAPIRCLTGGLGNGLWARSRWDRRFGLAYKRRRPARIYSPRIGLEVIVNFFDETRIDPILGIVRGRRRTRLVLLLSLIGFRRLTAMRSTHFFSRHGLPPSPSGSPLRPRDSNRHRQIGRTTRPLKIRPDRFQAVSERRQSWTKKRSSTSRTDAGASIGIK